MVNALIDLTAINDESGIEQSRPMLTQGGLSKTPNLVKSTASPIPELDELWSFVF